jgi:hypothetical protein
MNTTNFQKPPTPRRPTPTLARTVLANRITSVKVPNALFARTVLANTTYRYQENKTGNRSWGNPITEYPTPKPQVSSSPRYAATVGGHSPP